MSGNEKIVKYPNSQWVKRMCNFNDYYNPTNLEVRKLRIFLSMLPRWVESAGLPDTIIAKSNLAIEPSIITPNINIDWLVCSLIETRPLPFLGELIQSFLNAKLPLAIYCSDLNFDLVTQFASSPYLYSIRKVTFSQFTRQTYNALLMSQVFWETIPRVEKLLTLQSDTILSKESCITTLEEFRNYDFIGSYWEPTRPIMLEVNGGNGGISLRNVINSKKIIDTYTNVDWPGGEDSFFSFFTEFLGGNVPLTRREYEQFSVHIRPLQNQVVPFAMHKPPRDYHLRKLYYDKHFPLIKTVF